MENKNKIMILLVAALIVITISTGFIIKNVTTGKAVAEKETIKIGFTTPLSGNYAYVGEDLLRGAKEAINEANNEGVLNQKIELLVEDNQADSKTAITNYQFLKDRGVNVVFCSFSSISETLSPIANQDKTILMYEAMPTDYAEKYEYVFKVYSNAEDEAEVISKEVKKHPGKTAIVYVNNPTNAILNDIFIKKLGSMQKYSFDMNENDFRTVILKLKENKVENVLLNGYSGQIIKFMKQLSETESSVKRVFASSDGGSKNAIESIEGYLENSKIEYILVGYGKDNYYIFSYDLTKVLIKGMESCQALGNEPDDPECLKTELQKVKINGKSGFVDMDNSRIAKMSPQLYTVENKELVPYAG